LALEQGKQLGEVVDATALAKLIPAEKLTCPLGGRYTIGPYGTTPKCPHHGDLLTEYYREYAPAFPVKESVVDPSRPQH
jgi:hypothetical protein